MKLSVIVWQEEVWSDPYKDSEQWGVLWSLWRGKVCHPGWVGAVLHGEPGAAEGEEWSGDRAQISPQLRGPDHRKVCLQGTMYTHFNHENQKKYVNRSFLYIYTIGLDNLWRVSFSQEREKKFVVAYMKYF